MKVKHQQAILDYHKPFILELLGWFPKDKWVSSEDYDSWWQENPHLLMMPYGGDIPIMFAGYNPKVEFIHFLRDCGFIEQEVREDTNTFYRKRREL